MNYNLDVSICVFSIVIAILTAGILIKILVDTSKQIRHNIIFTKQEIARQRIDINNLMNNKTNYYQ